jgi:hypothetical protein
METRDWQQHFLSLLSEQNEKYEMLESRCNMMDSQRSLIVQTDIFDDGDTAWMLTSTVLVLFMTIPGLALYYSGMVRVENVLTTVMQILTITCTISVLWWSVGYSLAFGPADPNRESSPIIGDASRFFLRGMTLHSYHQLAPTIPEAVFCAYQLTFAIITPALICGSFADRMKYTPMIIFMVFYIYVISLCFVSVINIYMRAPSELALPIFFSLGSLAPSCVLPNSSLCLAPRRLPL